MPESRRYMALGGSIAHCARMDANHRRSLPLCYLRIQSALLRPRLHPTGEKWRDHRLSSAKSTLGWEWSRLGLSPSGQRRG